MRIYNLTNSVLSFSANNLRVNIAGYSVSDNIIINKEVINSSIRPLINIYGTKILLVLNSQEMSMIGIPGFGLPAENVTDYQDANDRLENIKKQLGIKIADKPEVESPRDDLNAGVPAMEPINDEKIDMPKLRKL